VLVIGGGPAGAAAAIYAARKGIRTGVVAERFGGQVLDTLGIENFISVQHTEGPKLVMALEQHVKEYGVDIMNLQRAAALIPGDGTAPGAARQRRHAQGQKRDPRHRRALARDERARREGLQGQGRLLLPALRRPAVPRQARGGDRRRQFRRRGGH
jgi:phytoene dehydrogenase-like protein